MKRRTLKTTIVTTLFAGLLTASTGALGSSERGVGFKVPEGGWWTVPGPVFPGPVYNFPIFVTVGWVLLPEACIWNCRGYVPVVTPPPGRATP